MRTPTQHTNPASALATVDRLTPEDLGVESETRALWRELKDDVALMARIAAGSLRWIVYRLQRTDHRSDPLELLATLMIKLAGVGASESFLRRIPLFLNRVIDECFSGRQQRSVEELDRLEFRYETEENSLSLERHIAGRDTPAALEDEADAIEREMSIEIERVRAIRRRARQIRNGLVVCS
jgi:hypothetical protein